MAAQYGSCALPLKSASFVVLVGLLGLGCEASGSRGTVPPGPVTMPADSGTPTEGEQPSMMPPSMPPNMPPADPSSCTTAPGQDFDGDGFANPDDCNDCSAQVSPAAFDVPGDGVDADCDGMDGAVDDCDSALPMAPTSAEEAARAIGLCRFIEPAESGWGVLSARFTDARGMGMPGSMLQVGILPAFGSIGPAEGANMLALSSGVARAPDQPNYTSECDMFGGLLPLGSPFPDGIPTTSPSCAGSPAPFLPGLDPSGLLFDAVALEVRVRVPSNATGFRFNSNFFTYEYPNYVCASFNDFFAVMRQTGSGPFENIVYDEDGNLVSVNNSLLQVCVPGNHGGKTFTCPEGREPLVGTGYDGTAACGWEIDGGLLGGGAEEDAGGATGWLRTLAPVTGGEEITLRFAIWDTGDSILDSTVLLDAFTWETEPIEVTVPETEPDPLI